MKLEEEQRICLRFGGPNKQHKEGQKGGVSAGILISQAGASGGPDADMSIQREEGGLLRTRPRIFLFWMGGGCKFSPEYCQGIHNKYSRQSSQDKISRILCKP